MDVAAYMRRMIDSSKKEGKKYFVVLKDVGVFIALLSVPPPPLGQLMNVAHCRHWGDGTRSSGDVFCRVVQLIEVCCHVSETVLSWAELLFGARGVVHRRIDWLIPCSTEGQCVHIPCASLATFNTLAGAAVTIHTG